MGRAVRLSDTATWWPSTLWLTSTLELRREGVRLLVDPGISRWEIDEVVAASPDPVGHVLVTHADWDHVMALGLLPDAEVVASAGAAERIASGEARESLEREAAEYYVEACDLDGLRVDRPIEPPAEISIGPWTAVCRAAPGHTEDGMAVWLPQEGILVVGDHLSERELPWAYSSVRDLRDTVRMLLGVIERERPELVVVGHGPPVSTEQALAVADADLDYLDGVLAYAAGGCDPDRPERIAIPRRTGGHGDLEAHAANVKLACAEAAVPV
jgi:glyoxylase-like metal-dependent hydrolase (beta-lactamase superfamily II)